MLHEQIAVRLSKADLDDLDAIVPEYGTRTEVVRRAVSEFLASHRLRAREAAHALGYGAEPLDDDEVAWISAAEAEQSAAWAAEHAGDDW